MPNNWLSVPPLSVCPLKQSYIRKKKCVCVLGVGGGGVKGGNERIAYL